VRGPLPESTMPPSRRSTSVNPRASQRLLRHDCETLASPSKTRPV